MAKKKPSCPLIGTDSNIYNLVSIASRTLKRNGMSDEAKEMSSRVYSNGSYDKALMVIDKRNTYLQEDTTMTEKQLQQAKSQLPQGKKFDRAYSAYEGGVRLISKTKEGREFRYTEHFEADGSVRIERF